MADEDTPDTPADADTPAPETPQHAVPSEEASEIAGSAEDAALEAAQEAIEAGGEKPVEPAAVEPAGEGHAVPSDDAQEIAGSAEDAALEALQESEDAVAIEAAVDEDADDDSAEQAPEATPAAKPSVPGAHLEVDIVPEGADPLGRESREQGFEDPYAVEGEDSEQPAGAEGDEQGEETLSEPIATAAIDLAADARYRATGKRKTAIARVTLKPGKGHLPDQRAHAGATLPARHPAAQHPPAAGDRRLPGEDGRRGPSARRRRLRTGRRTAPRRVAGTAGGRSQPARRAQAQGLSDARLARQGAQEGRPEEGP